MTGSASDTAAPSGTSRHRWVVPLSWAAIALEGFDLVVLAVVLPVLLDSPQWHLTPATASLVSTAGLLGVMVGALVVGPLADRHGRRLMMVASVLCFSVLTLACAWATGAVSLGVLRFVAGLGLGGVLPVAIVLVNEHGRAGRPGSATTLLMTGYHVGAVATPLLGIWLLPEHGWQALFVAGSVPGFVLAALLIRGLPDDRPDPATRDRRSKPVEQGKLSDLVRGGALRLSLAFWAAAFMGLLLVYGTNTWLPELMRVAGYGLQAALGQLLVLNVGAIAGLLTAGAVADRLGLRRTNPAWFLGAAGCLALMAVPMPALAVYVVVFLAGFFVFGALPLVYAWVSSSFPAHVRATALGATSGIGRVGAISGPVLAGLLLQWGLAYPWGFFAFAAAALAGTVATVAVGIVSRPASISAESETAGT